MKNRLKEQQKFSHHRIGLFASALRVALGFVFVIAATATLSAADFTVTNTDDSGAGSLRQAITDANGTLGADMILFAIPGTGQKTITLLSSLPAITETVTIDGGNNGVATNRVEITGAGALSTGLDLEGAAANGSAVRNLVINGFTSRQILLISAGSCVIQGNFIGLDATGSSTGTGNGGGIEAFASVGVLIGGADPAERNVIGANAAAAIEISGNGSCTIQGNYIGLDVSGTTRIGSPFAAISVNNASATVGGTGPGEGNVIVANVGVTFSGNPALIRSGGSVQGNFIGTDATGMIALNLGGGTGVQVLHATGVVINGGNVISGNGTGLAINSNGVSGTSSENTTVQGNFVGLAADGVTPLGNSGVGIDLFISPGNVIGGTGAGEGNVIAFNGSHGVQVGLTTVPIQGNSIFGNGQLGINLTGATEDGATGVTLNDLGDADTGGNNAQNFPVITGLTIASGTVTIDGTLNSEASKTYRLEFFASQNGDPSGYGEGQTFLGFEDVTTDASGDATFSVNFPVTGNPGAVTATATDPDGNTSEFCAAFTTKLLNISTRMQVLTDDNVLIGGFIVTGISPKRVIVRAIGPALSGFGVPGALMDPILELNAPDTSVTTNDNWKDDQQAEIEATGLRPLNDAESAIVATLAPGAYTAIVRGVGGTTGVGLVEAYDLDQPADSKLGNISTRGFIDTGDNVMIGGFIIGPENLGDATVLVRAIGPSLGDAGVANPVQDPTLELHNGDGDTIAENDNWKDSQEDEIAATGLMPTDDAESAILQTLSPGNYTAIVRGALETSGVGLVEVYHLQ